LIISNTKVAQRIPRRVVEVVYGIRIIQPAEGEDPNRKPTASELLSAYACLFLFIFFFFL
jgi:large subunit GTPase 1